MDNLWLVFWTPSERHMHTQKYNIADRKAFITIFSLWEFVREYAEYNDTFCYGPQLRAG